MPIRSFPLPDGTEIILDTEDLERVGRHRWRVERYPGRRPAIFTDIYIDGRWRKVSLGSFLLDRPAGYKIQKDPTAAELDYRKCNLFRGHSGEVKRRRGKPTGEFSSRYKGVYRFGDRWRASLQLDGKTISLGLHDTEEAAARAYDRGVLLYLGPCYFLNFAEATEGNP